MLFYQERLRDQERLKGTEVHLRCSWTVNAIAPSFLLQELLYIMCGRPKIPLFKSEPELKGFFSQRIFLYTSLFLFHCTGSWLEKGCRGEVSLKFIYIYYVVFVLWQWQLNIWLFIGDLPILWAMPCRSEMPSLPASALCLVWDSSGQHTVCPWHGAQAKLKKGWKSVKH